MAHAAKEATVQSRAEAKDMRIAALRETNAPRNPVRLSAAHQPVAHDGEDGPRTILAGVEGNQFIEESARRRKLRKPSLARAFRELMKSGGGHPEAKTVAVQERVEATERVVPSPRWNHAERVSETEAVPYGVESLRYFRNLVLYFGSVRKRRMSDIPDMARMAPVAHKTSAHPSPGTAYHTASTPDAEARIPVSAKTAHRSAPVA